MSVQRTTNSRSLVEVRSRRIRPSAISAPRRSWPMKVTRPSGGDGARGRLGHVVQQGGQAQRLAAGEVVGERARRAPRARGPRASGRPAPGRRPGRRRARRPRACARGRPRGGRGSARGPRDSSSSGTSAPSAAELVEPAEGPVGVAQPQYPRELVGEPLAGRVPQPRRRLARRGDGAGVDREPELLGEAGQPQQAHRVVGEGGWAAPAAGARARRSSRPPWRSMSRAVARGRHRQRVHGQVAAPEVLLPACRPAAA